MTLPPRHSRHQNNENDVPEQPPSDPASDSDGIEVSPSMSAESLYKVGISSVNNYNDQAVEFLQVARQLQLKAQEYRQKHQHEKRKLAETTNENITSKKKRQGSPQSDTNDEEEEVQIVAKAFTIMNLFWLHDQGKTFHTRIDDQYDPHQRFDTMNNKIQGQIAEIRAALPLQYLGALGGSESKWLKKAVCTH